MTRKDVLEKRKQAERDVVNRQGEVWYDEEIEQNRHRSTSCSLFALSVILFNITACLIVWWFVFGGR